MIWRDVLSMILNRRLRMLIFNLRSIRDLMVWRITLLVRVEWL